MEDDNDEALSADVTSIDQNGIPVYREIVVEDLIDTSALCDQNGARLMITNIVNENFKSYAGVQKLGPFHKNFSSIVGPNGSGKSNVIDSMLFVFGYRASKIRSKKISVLIHNSEKYKNIESCTVSVHFQKIIDSGPENSDFKVVEGSKFVVSRTAFRDSSSYYKINDRKVQHKEVDTFLKGVGVDLIHNRFLILQGEVEQIALMKPKAPSKGEDGMLEFLEDIIGSGRYKGPIEVLAKRIEDLTELKTEKYNRVKAIEKEKNELEQAKNEAVEYLEIENNVIRKKNMILQKNLCESEKIEKELVEKKASIAGELTNFETQLEDLTKRKKSLVKDTKDFIKKVGEMEKIYENNKREFSQYEEQDVRCQEDIKQCRIKLKKAETTLKSEETKLKEYKMIPDKQEKDSEAFREQLKKLQADKQREEERLNEVMATFQDETKDLQIEKEKKEKDLMEFQKNVNEAKQVYQVTQSELDLFKSNQTKETAKLADVRRNLERTQNAIKEKTSALEEVSQKLPATTTALETARNELAESNNLQHVKEDKLKELKMKVEIARSNFHAAQNQNKVLDFIMNLKRSGKIKGIHGRLGDLGAIDEKYDVAISTACGYLDHIVVESMDTAQKCIQALRDGNVGQATFIGLDHMAIWRDKCSRKTATPENVPRLFDLIKVNNKEMLTAFYFGVRDTLVAKDLDQATRIAYGSQRYRVVTLGGQLIDISGTMSGGGNKVIKGKMGSSIAVEVDPQELANMERQLEIGSREVEACRETKMKLEEMVNKLQKSHREMSYAVQKLTNELKNLNEQLVSFEKQEKVQEEAVKNSAPDEKKLTAIEKKVENLKKDYEKVQKVASDLEDEIHVLHQQIIEIGGKELKSIETRLGLLDTQIDQLNNTITKIEVAIKSAQRNAAKCEAKVESLKIEIVETREKFSHLEKEKQRIEVEADIVLKNLNLSLEDKKSYEKQLSEVTNEISKFDNEEQEIKREQIQVRHKLEKAEVDEKESKERTKSYKRSLGELTLNSINEGDELILETYTEEDLQGVDVHKVKGEIALAQEKLSNMRPNMAAIAEYKRKEDLYLKRMAEMTQVSTLKDQQRSKFDELRKKRFDEFMAGFGQITNKLKEMYQMITLGGDAELELVDSLDPFTEGIVFSVRPPKKSWKNICNLSGGEKTLSSLALVFALHHYKPTPFYVMDEIDAALDFRNVSIVAHYIKDRTKNAQFIVISLRNNMYELCDRLVGIYKTFNCTHSITLDPYTASSPTI